MHQIGTPGGSVGELRATAGERRVREGQRGETATARLLRQLFDGHDDIWVFHDLHVPGRRGRSGERANIDHVLLRGRNVVVLDSKRWAPGLYLTVAGRTVRAPFSRTPWVDNATVGLAVDRLRRHLPDRAVVAGAIVVHPAGQGVCYLRLVRPPQHTPTFLADSARARRWIRCHLGDASYPDPDIGQALHRLVIAPQA